MSTTATDEKGNRQMATHTTSPMSRIRASAKALGRFSVTFVREKRSDKHDSTSSMVSLDSVASSSAPEPLFGREKIEAKDSRSGKEKIDTRPSIGFGNAKSVLKEEAAASSFSKQDAGSGPFMSLQMSSSPQALRKGDSVKSETAIGPMSSLGVDSCSGDLALRRTCSAGEYGQPQPILGFRSGNMVRKVNWDPDLDSRKTAESFSDFLESARKNSAKQKQKYKGLGAGRCRRPSIQANERFDRFYSSDNMLLFSANSSNETPPPGNSSSGGEDGVAGDTRWDFEGVGFASQTAVTSVSAPNLGMMRETEGMAMRAISLVAENTAAGSGTRAAEQIDNIAHEIINEMQLATPPGLRSVGQSISGVALPDTNHSSSSSSGNTCMAQVAVRTEEIAHVSPSTATVTSSYVNQSPPPFANLAESPTLTSPPIVTSFAQTDSPPIKPRKSANVLPLNMPDNTGPTPPSSSTTLPSRRAGRFLIKATTPGEHQSNSAPTNPTLTSTGDMFNGFASSPLVPATAVVVCVTDNSGRVVSTERFSHSSGILSPILSAGMGEFELPASVPSTPTHLDGRQTGERPASFAGLTTPPNPSGLKPRADPAFLRSLSSGSEESNSSLLQSPGRRIDDREIAESAGHTPPPSRLSGRFRVAAVTAAPEVDVSPIAGKDPFDSGRSHQPFDDS